VQVDVGQGHALGAGGVLEADVVEVHVAVFDLRHGVFGVCEVALFIEHLIDPLGGGRGEGDHHKDHGEHHEAHEDLHGIGDHARERAEAEILPAGGDDEPRGEVGDQDHREIDAELHERGVEGENLLGLQEILAHVVGGFGEFLRLVVLAHEALDDAHALYVLLHGVVEPVVLFKDGLEQRQRLDDHERHAEAQQGNRAGKDPREALADRDGHDDRKNEHQGCAHCDANDHHERVLHVRDVGREPRHERGGRKPVDVGE